MAYIIMIMNKIYASALSSLKFWVQGFQFGSRVFDLELPIDAALSSVGV